MMIDMSVRELGRDGPKVSSLGLGCTSYARSGDEAEREAIRTIERALDAGFTFLDTADFYGSGVSEMNVGRAIRGRRHQVFLSVKFGAQVAPNGRMIGLDGRPSSVKNFAAYSLKRLGVDVIDLYQPARADPEVPYEDTIGAIAELIQEGKVHYLGVSEVGSELLRKAHAVHPVTALEIEYSLASRFIEPEILPAARELGIGIVAYRVLAEGLLTGTLPDEKPPEGAHFLAPRLHGDNYARNVETVKALNDMAACKKVSSAQLAMAWVLSRGPDIICLTGVSRPARIADNMAALDVVFTPDELSDLDGIFAAGAIVGARYPEFALRWAAQ